jgi:predicted membrane channel-forming protein YqfA (hemolysin III family)
MITRKRIFEIIEKSKDNDIASTIFDYFIMSVIILNVAAAIAGSFNDYSQKHRNLLLIFEYISVGII